MIKISLLFLATGLLVLGFGFFVPSASSVVSVELFNRTSTHNTQQLFKILGLVALLQGLLYRYTEGVLFSWRWSLMHWICFLCLLINVWTLGVLEQVLVPEGLARNPGIENPQIDLERFERIRAFYSGGLLLMLVMQLSYFLNLGIGIFRRNT